MNDTTYLVNTYADMILKISYNYLGNIYDAEDITQTVLIKLLDVDLQKVENEKAYIIRMTINTCKNLKASVWFTRVMGLHEGDKLVSENDLIATDTVLPYLVKLAPKYKTVLYLYYYEQYSVAEIAGMLCLKPQLVSTHLNRAKQKLKQMLGDDFIEKYLSN